MVRIADRETHWRVGASVFVCVFLLFGFSAQALSAPKGPMDFVNAAREKITEVSAEQVKADLDAGRKFILLDVRSKEEFDAGHLPHAKHVSRGLLEFMIGRAIPDKNAEIMLYCRTGARAALATQVLNDMGYVNARNMAGGFKAWGTAGYPIYNRHGEFVMKAFEVKK
jgi:rhodanese-related sulfurtransferase